jgi:3-oxoacyl-[acyl-carrier-protein] synthase II
MKRVVVTGMGGVTALGNSWEQIEARLRAGNNAVQRIPEWDRYEMLNTRLAAPITDFKTPAHYPRKRIRSMGRVSLLSVRATEFALADAGLSDNPMICDGRMGTAYGSSSGSIEPVRIAGNMLATGSMQGVTSTSYIQMMPHTTVVNTCLYFGLKGRVIPTSSACTSGSQAIGYAFESIRAGQQELMVAGGADELSVLSATVFDTLFATSTRNNMPDTTPRPFDSERDGLVIGEGAATLILEDYDAAQARGARVLAEVVGFGTNSSGAHITHPEAGSQAMAMQLALADAGISPSAIGYVSAHGTATDLGDIAEAQATREVLGRVPTSSMKSYIGHTLGACGAIEAWWGIEMMRRGWFAPTINLEDLDPACEGLDYITGSGREMTPEYFMSNNFAFGGINTSLIFRKI